MRLHFSPEVNKYLKKLKQKNSKQFTLVKKQLMLFEINPQHPSLRSHKISGKLNNTWSISIGLKLRLLYFIKDGEAWGFMIGSHDEVYRK